RLRLPGSQDRARLDQMQLRGLTEAGDNPPGTQNVAHQRAATRPQLDQVEWRGRADRLPGCRAPHPDKLAEHLRHFGRSDEIAGFAERIARHVIAMPRMTEAERHIAVEAHRPLRL